jgi:hypothetical protein
MVPSILSVSKWNCTCCPIPGTYHIILVDLYMILYVESTQQVNTEVCTRKIGIHRQSCTLEKFWRNARFHVFCVKNLIFFHEVVQKFWLCLKRYVSLLCRESNRYQYWYHSLPVLVPI